MTKIAFTIMVIIFCKAVLLGQQGNIRFNRYSTIDGLSNNTVNCIVQDSDGFMWFATDDGLTRFDASKFTVYQNDSENPNSLPSDKTRFLYYDKQDRLWICTRNGLSLYDRKFDNFKNFLPGRYVRSISEDEDGIFWLASRSGLIKFDPDSESFKIFQIDPKVGNTKENSILCTEIDSEGFIWTGTDGGGVYQFHQNSQKFIRYQHNQDKNSLSDNIVLSILRDSKDDIWIGTRDGLNLFQRESNSFIRFTKDNSKLGSNLIFSMVEDPEGFLWIGSYEGLSKFYYDPREVVHYTHNDENKYSLSGNLIRSLYLSEDKLLWAGTRDAGVNMIFNNSTGFVLYDKYFNSAGGRLSDNSINAIAEDNEGNIWLGTQNGLNVYYRNSHTYDTFQHDNNNANSLCNNSILCLLADRDDNIWVGTYGGGLDKYDRNTNTFKHYRHSDTNPASLGNNIVQWLFEDSEGIIWIGTDGAGLNRFDKSTGGFVRYPKDTNTPSGFSQSTVLSIVESKRHELFVGFHGGGLAIFDREAEAFNKVSIDPKLDQNLSVYSLDESRTGTLWLGTQKGLIYFNRETDEFRTYTTKDGLQTNLIYGVLVDDSSNVWFSSDRGISRFSADDSAFYHFHVSDGLQSSEFGVNSFHRGKSGRFYFGGPEGMNEFYPGDIVEKKQMKFPKITSFEVAGIEITVGDSTYLSRSILDTKKIALDYTDYIFAFDFSSFEFIHSSHQLYEYKLEGYDRYWVRTQNKTQRAYYTNVPPGEYTFKIKASLNGTQWIENPSAIQVVISPPYWETWWFYLLVVIALITVVYFFIQYRIHQALKVERIRIKLASDLHDDIGATLSKISMQAEVVEKGIDPKNEKRNLRRISELSSEVIDSMRDIIWAIDSRNDTIEKMIIKMKDTAFGLLAEKNIRVNFITENLDSGKKLRPEVRQNLYLISKEAINNIYKHSDATEVKIKLMSRADRLTLSITDNGNNFYDKKSHSGQGLENMRMRADRISANFNLNFEDGFSVTISNIK